MSQPTSSGGAGAAILLAVIAELIANSRGVIFLIGCLVALAFTYRHPLWRQIWSSIRSKPASAGAPHDDVRTKAEQAGHWLSALATEGSGSIAAKWFESNEATLKAMLDTTDPTADRVDDLAVIGDALEAWYVRQRNGDALLALGARLASIGEHANRADLQQLAALRVATAYRLLDDEATAEARLGQVTAGPRHRVTSAIEARHQHEHGLLHLVKAARYAAGLAEGDAAGANLQDAIRSARACFDKAALAVPRADLAADLAIQINLAVTYLYQSDLPSALDHLRLARARAAATHDASANAHVHELNGVAAWLQGNPRAAIGWWQQAEQCYADIDERIGQARCLQHRGAAELHGGRPAAAITLLLASADLLGGEPTGHELLEHYLGQARHALEPAAVPVTQPADPDRQPGLFGWLRRPRRPAKAQDILRAGKATRRPHSVSSQAKLSPAPLTLLRQSLQHLAWSAAEQREYLTSLGVAPSIDELALEFDDAIGPVKAVMADRDFPDDLRAVLTRIDSILDEVSKPPASATTWGWADLDRDYPWRELRRLARLAIEKLPTDGVVSC